LGKIFEFYENVSHIRRVFEALSSKNKACEIFSDLDIKWRWKVILLLYTPLTTCFGPQGYNFQINPHKVHN